ncbi:unnamed protein product, partial [Staurois parvus]
SAHCVLQHALTPLCPHSVILCGLPLGDWVAVVPSCFHFVIIPLTVDRGIFSSQEMSRMDLLYR